jgi:two-component system OmpR family response regulator
VRLLLIEDDLMLSEGVAAALRQDGYAVDVAGRATDALRLARAAVYDGAVLDLGLPDRDGIDLLRELRSEAFAFPILILTARDGLDDRIRGLDTGADDYLVKPFALGELEARLRALLRRAQDKTPWRQIGGLRFDLSGGRVLADGKDLALTQREFSVLTALARRVGKVVSKETLFDAVFPHDAEAAANAIEVYVSRVRRKIEPAGVTIRALRGLGYRLEEAKGAGKA